MSTLSADTLPDVLEISAALLSTAMQLQDEGRLSKTAYGLLFVALGCLASCLEDPTRRNVGTSLELTVGVEREEREYV